MNVHPAEVDQKRRARDEGGRSQCRHIAEPAAPHQRHENDEQAGGSRHEAQRPLAQLGPGRLAPDQTDGHGQIGQQWAVVVLGIEFSPLPLHPLGHDAGTRGLIGVHGPLAQIIKTQESRRDDHPNPLQG